MILLFNHKVMTFSGDENTSFEPKICFQYMTTKLLQTFFVGASTVIFRTQETTWSRATWKMLSLAVTGNGGENMQNTLVTYRLRMGITKSLWWTLGLSTWQSSDWLDCWWRKPRDTREGTSCCSRDSDCINRCKPHRWLSIHQDEHSTGDGS